MRILLSQLYPPVIGGEERHVRNLAAALAARGQEMVDGTLRRPGAPAEEMNGAMRVHRLPGVTVHRLSGLHAVHERPHAPLFSNPELTFALRAAVVRRLQAGSMMTRIEQVFRDVARKASDATVSPAPQACGGQSCL
jgi:glycosyltransferase involved in cell wall biosynthesis